ncbi:MAG TPA: right-handed parallel beta-helix repeat-containing protein [Edaphobacter sp.]|nr:right-handed parallel beta-helix repeat-containing protein [Edaphobacter sp.]
MVIWRAATENPAILDGSIRIRGWHLTNRKMNLWSAKVMRGTSALQLFVNGKRAVRARGLGCKSPIQCRYTPTGLTGVDPRIAHFRRPKNLIAVFAVRWRDFHCPVASASGTTLIMVEPCWHNTVVDSKNGWSNASPKGRPFAGIDWFENAYELLGTPGQFYLDTDASRIYYVPRPGEDLNTADVELPIMPSLLTLTGSPEAPVHDIRFEGIEFTHTTWLQPDTNEGYVSLQAGYLVTGKRDRLPDNGEGMMRIQTAVTVLGGKRISFLQDNFQALGTAGIALAGGTRDSIIANSVFTDISGGAIFIGDTTAYPLDPQEKSSNNKVERNVITHVALEYRDNVGIMGGFNNGLTIDRNTVEDIPYTGISVGWGWNYEGEGDTQRNIRITRNKVRNFMLDLYDGGAIYTQAQSPGSVVCANYIDFSGTHHANGIYLDERSRDYEVHNNVVWNRVGKGDNWLSAWSSWSGNLLMTHNWTDDPYPKPHNPGPTKIFGPNFLGLKSLPEGARVVISNAGASAPETETGDPCAY